MPDYLKTERARWIATVLATVFATTITIACSGAWWSSGMNTWRDSVTEDLAEVKADVKDLKEDMTQLTTDVRWIRDGKHLHDLAMEEHRGE